MRFLLFLLSLPIFAAVDNLTVQHATSMQMVVSYTAPTTAACTLEASVESDYTPLALDVDDTASDGTPAYYTGASLDSRTGNITNGRTRVFVLGKHATTPGLEGIEVALDSYTRSRALRADTMYYIRVTCGGDTATISAKTANIMLGATNAVALAVKEPFVYKQVSQNPIANPEFIDPYTGSLIKQFAPFLSWQYAASTKDSGLMATNGSDCNQTITGVLGSCKFSSAAGTNWTATTGTLTDAIRTDDSNYTEYSGTSQDVLRVYLGRGKIPNNTSVAEMFSWQNMILRGKTSSTTGDGEDIEVCISLDLDIGTNCNSPWWTLSLTTSDATYRICKDAPCSDAERSGDFMTDQDPSVTYKFGRSRVYNEAGTLTTIKFTGTYAEDDCNRLNVGEAISAQNVNEGGLPNYVFTVSSKDCAASPPQFTSTETGQSIANNGTLGTGFFTGHGISSAHYGLLIRKKSTTEGSTISIGYALWRAAWSAEERLNFASGGFGKKCQQVPTAGGYYLCATGNPGVVIGIKPSADGLDIKNYGGLNYRGDQLVGAALSSTTIGCSLGGNEMSWDDVTPGRFYCSFPTTYPNPANGGTVDGRTVLVMMDMTLTERSAGNPDGYDSTLMSNAAISSAIILNPCLNSCTSVDDDYTTVAQIKRYSPTEFIPEMYPSCGTGGVSGDYVFAYCSAGSQNSPAWIFAFDLGNRLPIGSGYVGQNGNAQNIDRGTSSGAPAASRWCHSHTGVNSTEAGGGDFVVTETNMGCVHGVTSTSNMSTCSANTEPGTCDACPSVTMDGFDYTGKNWCSTLNITSAWSGSYVPSSAPSYFETGDPLYAGGGVCGGMHYFQKIQAGDYIFGGNEFMRVLQRNSNTQFVLIRGWGSWYDSVGYSTKTHTSPLTYTPICNVSGKHPKLTDPSDEGGAPVWNFKTDTDGSASFLTNYQNHAFFFNDGAKSFGVKPNGPSTLSGSLLVGLFTTAAEHEGLFNKDTAGSNGDANIGQPISFAGKETWCYGNACETHPGAQQVVGDALAKTWYHDIRVRLGLKAGNTTAVTSGKTYIHELGGTLNVDPRHTELETYSGYLPFQVTDTLTDGGASTGKWCWAVVANDCFSGSTAGKVYFASEVYDRAWMGVSSGTCREAIFAIANADHCQGNGTGASAATIQTKFPTYNGQMIPNGGYTRVVEKALRKYREAATENVHSDPTGTVLLTRFYQYIVPPRFVSTDSKNRSTFLPIPVTVSTVPGGTDNALVEFGYTTDFLCNRQKGLSCMAESAAINETTPYKFSHETLTGVSCSGGCTITIPALANRVVYWRMVYRNSGGSIIATGATNVQAVN